MNKHKSNKIKENSYTVRHLIMGQIITTQNIVAIKEVRHAGQWHGAVCCWPHCRGKYNADFKLQPCNWGEVWVRIHDDVLKWKHFPRNWPFVRGNSPVPGEFPTQRPVTRNFDVFFDLRLNKRLSKQWWGWRTETLSCPLWRHCHVSCDMLSPE